MSVALLVILAANRAPSWDAWNQALLESESLPVLTQSVELSSHRGFLPAVLGGKETGFYFVVDSYSEIRARYPSMPRLSLDHPVVYSLSFGPNPDECASAFLSASVLVTRFSGVAFDAQAGKAMDATQLTGAAHACSRL